MSSPRRRRSAAAKRGSNGRRRIATIRGDDDPQSLHDRIAVQRKKRLAIEPPRPDQRWKIAVATITVEGAIAAAHAASLSDVLNNVLVGMFGARITPIGHDQFWQTIVLMLVVGVTALTYIIALRRR